MPCNIPMERIFEYADDELNPLDKVDFERHLAGCDTCRSHFDMVQRMRADITAELSVEAPPYLGRKIANTLERELNQEVLAGSRVAQSLVQRLGQGNAWAQIAAVIVLTAGITLASSLAFFGRPDQKESVAQEVASAYRRALFQDSVVALADTDGARLRQWFQQKSLAVPATLSFSQDGFALRGGRLDFVDGKKAAALVYGHESHQIDVFIWPETHAEQKPEFKTSKNLNVAYWFQNGLEFWAVSDASAEELQHLSALMMTKS